MKSAKKRRCILVSILFSLVILYVKPRSGLWKLLLLHHPSTAVHRIKPYSSVEIGHFARHLMSSHPMVLVFNGTTFEAYNLDYRINIYHKKSNFCGRCLKVVPLLVHALMNLNPSRFAPGQPVFQVLFSTGDSVKSPCANPGRCQVHDFAPLLLFGSVPTDPKVMPSIKAFPNWFYLSCLYEYKFNGTKPCQWVESINRTIPWSDLKEQIIWRGNDFSFLPEYDEFQFKRTQSLDDINATTKEEATKQLRRHWANLGPRWRAVVLSIENDTWIDAKFSGGVKEQFHEHFLRNGLNVGTREPCPPAMMSHFKYQLDLGGGGGTSWRGTLSKLGMPGLLFHHETPNVDWFYNDMKRWIHYVPVHWSLGDLYDKFLWVQEHPSEARSIADEASKLFSYLMGEQYMKKLYDELFVDYLGELLDAYVTSSRSWEEEMEFYHSNGFVLLRIAACDQHTCHTFSERSTESNLHHLPGLAS
jgi:Glycosyl transferase family 90